ncbi:CpaF family protein [Aneurinibacillus tyrosinisolvens]|uniref:CpaF family protein n=1 Tax=Aneurinibacillus tyrosinisolvens TaxID=1443435 RepID=UPI00063F16AC|nr:ATPase, T2SS/T4P/T4SS family [Aneurinibacillus tyrosinisolvens]
MSLVKYDELGQLKQSKKIQIHFEDSPYQVPQIKRAISKTVQILTETEPELVNNVYAKKIPKSAAEDVVDSILESGRIECPIPFAELKKLVLDELFGYGVLQPYLDEPEITDLFINRHNQLLKRVKGRDYPIPFKFNSPEELDEYFRRIRTRLGVKADQFDPLVDTKDEVRQMRLNGGLPPVVSEPYFTFRKHHMDKFDIDMLVKVGSLPLEMAEDIKKYVCSWQNILISGPTGSGKTTHLRAYTQFIAENDPYERIAVLEEEAELGNLGMANVVSFETKKKKGEDDHPIEMDILVKNAMRLSMRRVILGELRHRESLELIRAFGTGHDGGMSSIHANGVKEALQQLAFLMLYANTPLKYEHLLSMIANSVDIVVHIERHKVVDISEVVKFDATNQQIITRPLWEYVVDPKTDVGTHTRYEPSEQLLKKMALRRSLRKH